MDEQTKNVEAIDLKLPKYILYNNETGEILCASTHLDAIDDYLSKDVYVRLIDNLKKAVLDLKMVEDDNKVTEK